MASAARAAQTAAAERARVKVTQRIREALAQIGLHDGIVGQALDRSVETGTLCRYESPQHP